MSGRFNFLFSHDCLFSRFDGLKSIDFRTGHWWGGDRDNEWGDWPLLPIYYYSILQPASQCTRERPARSVWGKKSCLQRRGQLYMCVIGVEWGIDMRFDRSHNDDFCSCSAYRLCRFWAATRMRETPRWRMVWSWPWSCHLINSTVTLKAKKKTNWNKWLDNNYVVVWEHATWARDNSKMNSKTYYMQSNWHYAKYFVHIQLSNTSFVNGLRQFSLPHSHC